MLTILGGAFIGLTLGWLNSYCASKPVRREIEQWEWETTPEADEADDDA